MAEEEGGEEEEGEEEQEEEAEKALFSWLSSLPQLRAAAVSCACACTASTCRLCSSSAELLWMLSRLLPLAAKALSSREPCSAEAAEATLLELALDSAGSLPEPAEPEPEKYERGCAGAGAGREGPLG